MKDLCYKDRCFTSIFIELIYTEDVKWWTYQKMTNIFSTGQAHTVYFLHQT